MLDIPAGTVTVYRKPSGAHFLAVEEHGREATLGIAAFPDVAIALADLFQVD
ncbi:MAG TPA: hypothetical protein VH877_09150 [Polyangia bacterium]|jgi:hypothetical protein|nr:hypothetical protein [Polyangia bacterium]